MRAAAAAWCAWASSTWRRPPATPPPAARSGCHPPRRVRLEPYGSTGPNRIPGTVERLVYQGPATQLVVRLANGGSLQASVQNQGQPLSRQQGTAIAVHLPADALRVLADQSG